MSQDTMGNQCQVVGCFGIPTGIVCVTLPLIGTDYIIDQEVAVCEVHKRKLQFYTIAKRFYN